MKTGCEYVRLYCTIEEDTLMEIFARILNDPTRILEDPCKDC